jgi:hypothetical protein
MIIKRHYIGYATTRYYIGDQFRLTLESDSRENGIIKFWFGSTCNSENNTKSFDEGEKMLKEMFPMGVYFTGTTVINHKEFTMKLI